MASERDQRTGRSAAPAWTASTARGPDGPRRIASLVAGNPDLARLAEHAAVVAGLERALAAWLDGPLKARCRVGNVTATQIVLLAESSAWSQRMRFLVPEIGRHLNRALGEMAVKPEGYREVVVKVASPPEREAPRPVARAGALSSRNAALVAEVAERTDDPALAAVLRRLATRVTDGA